MSSSQEFRSRVACRERLIGIFVKTIDHSVIEILGHRTGVDFVVLDLSMQVRPEPSTLASSLRGQYHCRYL